MMARISLPSEKCGSCLSRKMLGAKNDRKSKVYYIISVNMHSIGEQAQQMKGFSHKRYMRWIYR